MQVMKLKLLKIVTMLFSVLVVILKVILYNNACLLQTFPSSINVFFSKALFLNLATRVAFNAQLQNRVFILSF